MNSYLASASPRRLEILNKFGFSPISIPVEHDEIFSADFSVEENCMAVAYQKAYTSYLTHYPQGLVIAGDTTVAFEKETLNKPKDEEDAKRMLRLLRGKTHRVISSFCLYDPQKKISVVDYDVSFVTFKDFSSKELEDYIHTQEYQDKAGAYGIQGQASLLIHHYQGSLYNIIGFPMEKMLIYWEKVKVLYERESK